MEIDQAIYNQYRDTPFKPDELKNNQTSIFFGQKIKNPNMDDYVNYVLEKTEELPLQKDKRNSYNIILTTSLDKTKHSNLNNNSILNSKNEMSNLDTTNAYSKSDVILNLKNHKNYYDNNNEKIYNNLEKKDISGNNNYNEHILNEEENRNKDNNGMIIDNNNENNFGGINKKENYIYNNLNKNEVENIYQYYNPFSENNNYENNKQNNQINKHNINEHIIENNSGKLPNIILTAYHQPIKTYNKKDGIIHNFINLFSNRKPKNQENEDSKLDKILNKEKDKLQTLEQKLINEEEKIKNNEEKLNNELNNYDKKIDLVLGIMSSKKENLNSNEDIEKLKSDLSGNEYENEENNTLNKNNYDNNKCFMVQAEPILNSDNKKNSRNFSDENNDLDNSYQLVDIDKSSEYTLQTGTNIDQLIRKKSKFSPLLMGILLGSCALFYFLYKKIKLKEILTQISELFKKVPEFGNYILSFIGQGFEDFMERYDDVNRLFFGILCVISFWFIFKTLMKKLFKRQKN